MTEKNQFGPAPEEEKTQSAEQAPAEQELPEAAGEEKDAPQEDARYQIQLPNLDEEIPDYVPAQNPAPIVEEGKKPRRPAKRGAGCFGTVVYTVAILLVSVFFAVVVLTVLNDITGLVKDDVQIDVTIPEGATLSDIADILQENHIINSAVGLKAYAKITNAGSNYQYGVYTLNPRMGYSELLSALQQQTTFRKTVDVQIIEGRTVEQIAEILEAKQVCSAAEFLDAVNNGDFSDYDFVAQIPDNADRKYRLEGYIFPDTYEFYVADTAENVIRKFLDAFEKRVTEEMRAEAEAQGMTIDELITLASIVQKEGKSQNTMELVSSVFRNRLNNPQEYPYLQSNATLSYALGEAIVWATNEQMNNPDPYNSYTNEGLPPGAICNPGKQAIEAVLANEKSDYYYFVTDDNGLFYFSKTAREHQREVEAIQETGQGSRGTGKRVS